MTDNPETSATSADDALFELPGINVDAGLRVTRQDRTMYRRLLVKFLDSWANYRQLFEERGNDPAAIVDLAHNLKGVAANLGIEGVQRLAGDLETSCRAGPPTGAADTRDLCDEMERVLEGLRTLERASRREPG